MSVSPLSRHWSIYSSAHPRDARGSLSANYAHAMNTNPEPTDTATASEAEQYDLELLLGDDE